MKNLLSKIYRATLGKKAVTGGVLMLIGGSVAGPVGATLVKIGELVLLVGLGDKGIRGVAKKVTNKKGQ